MPSATITLTDQGAVPAVITVTVGVQVTWVNDTGQAIRFSDQPLDAGTGRQLFLPFVTNAGGGAATSGAPDAEPAAVAYLAVLGLESGVPFHVQAAKAAGATRAEVISAMLVGLPAAGNRVTQVLPAVVTA